MALLHLLLPPCKIHSQIVVRYTNLERFPNPFSHCIPEEIALVPISGYQPDTEQKHLINLLLSMNNLWKQTRVLSYSLYVWVSSTSDRFLHWKKNKKNSRALSSWNVSILRTLAISPPPHWKQDAESHLGYPGDLTYRNSQFCSLTVL